MNRKRLRLNNYDYAQPGMYFVTVCVKDQQCALGTIKQGEVQLNPAGVIVNDVLKSIPQRFENVRIDSSVVMPNHVHMIVQILNEIPGAINRAPTIGEIIRRWKAISARSIRLDGYLFDWQRNFYERVIPNEKELFETRKYIAENPLKWELDPENPGVINAAPTVNL